MTLAELHQALLRGDAAARSHVQRLAVLSQDKSASPRTREQAGTAIQALNLLEQQRRATSYRAHGAPRIGGYGMPSSHRPGFGAPNVRPTLTPERAARLHALCNAAKQGSPTMSYYPRHPFRQILDEGLPPSISGLRLGRNPLAAAYHQDTGVPPSIAGMMGAAHPSSAQLAFNASSPVPGGPTQAQLSAFHSQGNWPHHSHSYWPGYGYVYPYWFANYWPNYFRCVQTVYGPICFRVYPRPWASSYVPALGGLQYM